MAERAMQQFNTPSTTELVSSMISDVGDIVRAEVKLASVEVREDARRLAHTIPIGATGGVLAATSVVLLLMGAAFALDIVLPVWAAYLIVGGITMAIALGLVLVARSRLTGHNFVPERTLATLEENKRWIRRKLS